MSTWGAVTWDVARAGGFTAYLLLTLAVAVGLALTLHWQSPRWPRLINSEMHNFLTLLSTVFVVVHVLAVWIDPFTRFGWSEVFLPFVSHYRPVWMAFGIVSLYLGIAIGLSTWLRPMIGYTWWRRLHVLTLAIFGMVTIHGLSTGSDTRTWWALAIYAGSLVLVGTLLVIRLLVPATPKGRAHPAWAALTAVVLFIVAAGTLLGPLQPGWNAIANNGQGAGGVALAAGASSASSSSMGSTAATHASGTSSAAFAVPFTSSATGLLTQQGPDSAGNVTMQMQLTLSGQAPGTLTLVLHGQASSGSDDGTGAISVSTTTLTLGSSASVPLYTGTITSLDAGTSTWRVAGTVTGTGATSGSLNLSLRLQVGSSGQVRGTVRGTAGSAGV